MPMNERMAGIVSRILAVSAPAGEAGAATPPVTAQKPDALASLLAPSADRTAIQQMLAAVAPWGACRVGEVLDGDGERSSRVRLRCERGDLDLTLWLDGATGAITRLSLMPPGGNACAQ